MRCFCWRGWSCSRGWTEDVAGYGVPRPPALRRYICGTMSSPRPVIVGTGIAGLWTAWRLASEGQAAVLVTKETLADSASSWAQGGIAVALGPGDSPSQHAADTLAASDGLADPEAVRILTSEGPDRIYELLALGARVRPRARRAPAVRSRSRPYAAPGSSTPAATEPAPRSSDASRRSSATIRSSSCSSTPRSPASFPMEARCSA